MSKKILVLSASPIREGNSDTLCDEFIRGTREAGNQAEKIFLRDKNIDYCYGCRECNSTHECVQKDDMTEVLDKIVKADVIVMAAPVYFYTMNAQMKTLIDRTYPRYTEISGDFYFIVTAAVSSKGAVQRTIDGFRGFLDCLPRAREKGIVYGLGARFKGEILGKPAMKQAYEMGKSV